MRNENGVSGNTPLNLILLTATTENLINFIKLLKQCDTEERINYLFDGAYGPAFDQIINSSDWDSNEHITMKNKDISVNMLLYEETIGRRREKVGAIRKGSNVMSIAKYFRYPATKSIFLGMLDSKKNNQSCRMENK